MSAIILPFKPPAAQFRLGQRPCLDGLRGAAALLVVACHFLSQFGFFVGGVVGLEILFALSGFLITALLIEEWERSGSIALGPFYRRRLRRLMPPLLALLVGGSAISLALREESVRGLAVDSLLTASFVSNGAFGLPPPHLRFLHTWSLSLEVQFYLLWPPALYLLLKARVNRMWILTAMAALAVTMGVWRAALYVGYGAPRGIVDRLYFSLDTHADALLLGCLAGAASAWNLIPEGWRSGAVLRRAGWSATSILAWQVWRCHHGHPSFYYGLCSLAAVASTVVVLWVAHAPPPIVQRILGSRVMVGFGAISYGLYLYHWPIFVWFLPRSAGPIAFAVALSLVAAAASSLTIERNVVRRRGPEPVPFPTHEPFRRAA